MKGKILAFLVNLIILLQIFGNVVWAYEYSDNIENAKKTNELSYLEENNITQKQENAKEDKLDEGSTGDYNGKNLTEDDESIEGNVEDALNGKELYEDEPEEVLQEKNEETNNEEDNKVKEKKNEQVNVDLKNNSSNEYIDERTINENIIEESNKEKTTVGEVNEIESQKTQEKQENKSEETKKEQQEQVIEESNDSVNEVNVERNTIKSIKNTTTESNEVNPDSGDEYEKIEFKDEAFREYLINSYDNYDFDHDKEITKLDMENLEELNIFDENIKDISGIEYAVNLRILRIYNTSGITDLTPLIKLKKLEEIQLPYNFNDNWEILSKIEKLKKIVINYITDDDIKGIKNLPKLTTLEIHGVETNDGTLNLESETVENLLLYNCNISLNEIKNLSSLKVLKLEEFNKIRDIDELLNFENLAEVYLNYENASEYNNFDNFGNFNGKIYINITNWYKINNIISFLNNTPDFVEPNINSVYIEKQMGKLNKGVSYELKFEDINQLFKELKNENSKIGKKYNGNIKMTSYEDDESFVIDNDNQKIIINYDEYGEYSKNIYYDTGEICGYINLYFEVTNNADELNEIVEISDENLKNLLIKQGYDKDENYCFSKYEIESINTLSIFKEDNIQDFSVLEKAINLEEIHIENAENKDIQSISDLKQIKKLYINNYVDTIVDISPISKLVNLEELELSLSLQDCNCLETLANIKRLTLNGKLENTVYDLSFLKNYTQLEYLSIDSTYTPTLKNIESLKNCTKLTNIYIYGEIDLEDMDIDTKVTYKYDDLNPILSLFNNKNSSLYGKKYVNSIEYGNPEPDSSSITLDEENATLEIYSGKIINSKYGYSFSISTEYNENVQVHFNYNYRTVYKGDSNIKIDISDENLKQYLLEQYDIDNDGEITDLDMKNIRSLYIIDENITNYSGLEYASNLEELKIYNGENLTCIDNFEKLKKLYIESINNIDYTSISKIKSLENLEFYGDLNQMDIDKLNTINQITTLIIGGYNYNNNISKLNITNLKELTLEVYGYYNLEDFVGLSNLETLKIDVYGLKNVDALLNFTNIKNVYINYYSFDDNEENKAKYANLKNFTGTIHLRLPDNSAQMLDFINFFNSTPSCVVIDSVVNFTTDIGAIKKGKTAEIKFEEISPIIKEINNSSSKIGKMYNGKINIIKGSYNSNDSFIVNNDTQTITINSNEEGDNYQFLTYNNGKINGSIHLKYNVADNADELNEVINIPDVNLKKYLLQYDLNGNGELTAYELSKINGSFSASNVEDLTGIEYLINVKEIYLWGCKVKKASDLEKVLPKLPNIEKFEINANFEDVDGLDELKKQYPALVTGSQICFEKDFGNVEMNSEIKIELPNSYFQLINKYGKDALSGQKYYDQKEVIIDTSTIGENRFYITLNTSKYTPNTICSFSYVVKFNVVYSGGDKEKEVIFKDEELNKILRQNYDIDGNGKITEHDLLNISDIYIDGNVKNIEGIEKLENLKTISVENTKITDISPILKFENLYSVSLYNNNISDITSLSSRKLKDITSFFWYNNFIDLSNNSENVKILKEEYYKDYESNGYDIGYFTENTIEAIISQIASTQKFGKPEDYEKEVVFGDEKIKNKLIELGADLNNDGKLTRNELGAATQYKWDAEQNKPTAIIKKLDLSGMGITDISGLEYLNNLEYLDLSNNNINDITPLSHLFNLDYLNLSNNKIEDISSLPNYAINYVIGNIDEITTKEINLSGNKIKDISCMKNWVCLKNSSSVGFSGHGNPKNSRQVVLDLSNNEIENADIVKDFKTLRKLNLSGNKIKDITFLKEYNFELNSRKLIEGYFGETIDNEDMIEGLTDFEGIDLSNNYIDVNDSKMNDAINCFKIKNVEVKIDNQHKSNVSVAYGTHIQNIGWQKYVKDGSMSGTSGKALRLEGIKIKLENQAVSGNVEYSTHVQNIGWQNYVKNDQLSGTSGKALRLEGIRIRLTGEIAKQYDIYYRVHCQNLGWLGWAKNGEDSGSSGYAYRLEGIEIKLVKKGEAAPGSTANAFCKAPASIYYSTHVQNIGWQGYVKNGEMSGTSGKGLRLEGIKIKIMNPDVSGNIEYSTHVQNIGWQNYVKNDQIAGTVGKGLRLEGIRIRLTGELSKKYDVYYRVHCQNLGWLGWAKNGEDSGSSGYAYRLEGIEIKLVPKGENGPTSSKNAFYKK